MLLRYRRAGGKTKQPLTITGGNEILLVLNQFKQLRPRTFYASACTYKELVNADNIRYVSNIESCTPTWDIDNAPDKWKATIETAQTILQFLRQEGVSRSVFLKWSGKGLHVHVHQDAVSQAVLQRISPLDAAYAIVEHTNRSLRGLYAEIAEKHDAKELTVENEMDIQRVFTCPLSLHRNLNVVIVCFPPASIEDFNPDWTRPDSYRHWRNWDQSEPGEADSLAEKAYRTTGGYKIKTQHKQKPGQPENLLTNWMKKEPAP